MRRPERPTRKANRCGGTDIMARRGILDLGREVEMGISDGCNGGTRWTKRLEPGLQRIVADISDVSRYVWERGWSAANGGNLTVDVSEAVAASDFPAGLEMIPLPVPVEHWPDAPCS